MRTKRIKRLLVCECGKEIWAEIPERIECSCGRLYIWKKRRESGHYVLIRRP